MKTQTRKYIRTDDDQFAEEYNKYQIVPEEPVLNNPPPEPKGILGLNNMYFLALAILVLIGVGILIFYKGDSQ